MKSKIKYINGLLFCILSLLFSCTDVLEMAPVSSITDESFWNTQDDAEGALEGMYYELRVSAVEDLFLLGELRGETMWSSESSTGVTGNSYLYYNTLDQFNAGGVDWTNLYTVVHHANLLLDHVPGIPFTSESSKNNILAQAYAMRAYLYYVMARTWGGVPLRIVPIEGYSAETTNMARSSIEDVIKLIKQDLDMAISLFANSDFSAGRNRWSLPATYALKADVYLYTGKVHNGGNADFTTALDACTEVQKADVALVQNFGDVFKYSNKGNKEFIMSVGFLENEPGSDDNYFRYMYSAPESNTLDPITGELITQVSGGISLVLTQLVQNQFDLDDERRNGTFINLADEYNWPTLTAMKGRGVLIAGKRYFTSDVILYRYADVLLMKAEAKNALGQDPSAEINMVRQRAYKDAYSSHVFVNGSKIQNDDAILKERLLELAVEGKRWWDLVRFGKVFDLVPTLQDRIGQDYLLLFPISVDVLSREPEVDQNPGWD